jgi:WD40 repeat protein
MSAVNCAAFSPDGSRIITASDDGRLRVWDRQDGQRIDTVASMSHDASVRFAVYSPNGRYIVTTSDDGTGCIWMAETGERVHRLVGEHRAAVLCAAFSLDSRWVVTGSRDQEARIWEVETGRPIAVIRGHTAAVNSVAFSLDRRRVLTGSDDETAKLWDSRLETTGAGDSLPELREVLSLSGHSAEVVSASFSPNGQRILTAGRDARVIVWPAVYLPPSIHLSVGECQLADGPGPTLLDGKAQICAANSPTFDRGRLVVELTASSGGKGGLVVYDDASGSSPVVVLPDGQVAYRDRGTAPPLVVGQMNREDAGGRVEFLFNRETSCQVVEAILRRVACDNSSAALAADLGEVRIQLTDGLGSASQPVLLKLRPPSEASAQKELAVTQAGKHPARGS